MQHTSMRTVPSATVLDRFADVTAADFANRLQGLRQAEQEILDKVVEQVESELISPLQGLGIIGCAASQLYGVQAFHGQPSFADIWSATRYEG